LGCRLQQLVDGAASRPCCHAICRTLLTAFIALPAQTLPVFRVLFTNTTVKTSFDPSFALTGVGDVLAGHI